MDDQAILTLFRQRQDRAIAETEAKYGKLCFRVADNILADAQDAEECVNDTYLGVWDRIPPLRPDSLGSYVCRIARNLAVSKLRSETAQKRDGGFELVLDELAEVVPSGVDLEDELMARETLRAIEAFLSAQDSEDRCLFVRRYWFADSVGDIAAATHSRESRVSARLFRLRGKLRKYLQKEGLLV